MTATERTLARSRALVRIGAGVELDLESIDTLQAGNQLAGHGTLVEVDEMGGAVELAGLAERAVHEGEQNDRQGKAEGEPAGVNNEALDLQDSYVPWAEHGSVPQAAAGEVQENFLQGDLVRRADPRF